jgi:hypothetical protein
MAEIKAYTGSAGTGKTTKLISLLSTEIKDLRKDSHQCILALTFMHGSRRRLDEKLSFLKKEKIKHKCKTIDSFATNIVERFRRYLNISKHITVVPNETNDTEREDNFRCYVNWSFVRKSFVHLLKFASIRNFISISYPIIIVDEFQDCESDLLDIIKAIYQCDTKIFIAGDDFQQLNNLESCEAINWLSSVSVPFVLKDIHRSSETDILATSFGLRNNTFVRNSIKTKVTSSADLAAWHISSYIHWKQWGRNGNYLVLLYPVSPEKSLFVKKALSRLENAFPKNNFSPHPFKIETSQGVSVEFANSLLENHVDSTVCRALLNDWLSKEDITITEASKKALKLLSLRGLDSIDKFEFSVLLSNTLHQHRSFSCNPSKTNHLAMTIHAAKNREFDHVIILWPYEVSKGDIYKRKLLYNAITRAKHKVLLIVQGKDEASFRKDKTLTLLGNIDFDSKKKKSASKND